MSILKPPGEEQDQQKRIDGLMSTPLGVPEKGLLIMLVKKDRIAVSINSITPFPDLSEIGLFVRSVQLTVKPITDEVREKLARDGFCLPANDMEETTFYIHFVSEDKEIAALLEKAFHEGNLKLIANLTRSTSYLPGIQ